MGETVDILGDLGVKVGTLSIDPQVLDPTKPGKLGGDGSLNVGVGNDTTDSGPLKVKLKSTSLSISLKVGKKKVSFKGRLEGANWVGSITVQAKPVAIKKLPFSILAQGVFAPLPPKGTSSGKCGEDIDVARTGSRLHNIDMIGGFFGGSAELIVSPAGNLAIVHSFPSGDNSHWYAEKNCLEINPEPDGSRNREVDLPS